MEGRSLNDLTFDTTPLTLFTPDPSSQPDEKALAEAREHNRKLIESVRQTIQTK